MILACDIGNTRIKTALFKDSSITEVRSFTNVKELLDYCDKNKVKNIAVSSVVPTTSKTLEEQLKKINISPFFINSESKFNLKNEYKTPSTLGIDRICSAEGAFYLYQHSSNFKSKNYSEKDFILTIDFGTATTLNFVKYPGIFMGGIIAPGINMMFNSLLTNTAQLPSVQIDDYQNFIGADTNQSISSGIINSSIGLIERTIKHLKQNLNAEIINVFITGGNANKILEYLKFDFTFEASLVLIGVKAVWEVNKK